MTGIKAVPEQQPDPKIGKPKSKAAITVPYFSLSSSIEAAKAIHANNGGVCNREQLAAYLEYKSKDNGSFMSRVTAAKMFGLIEQEGDQLRITERGREIVAEITPTRAAHAKVQAFLAVDLFRLIYEELGGSPMPEEAGLRNMIARHGVIAARVPPSVRILKESAEEAGFFKSGPGRMVMPSTAALGKGTADLPHSASRDEGRQDGIPRHGNGGGGGGGVDPAIAVLLKKLPATGTILTEKRRAQLIDAFRAWVQFSYESAEEEE